MDWSLPARDERVTHFAPDAYVETFAWRHLRFHVVTPEPLTPEQIRVLARSLPKISRVGLFAELVAMVLGRYVRIRTERPSPDVRFEVGRLETTGDDATRRRS